MCFTNYSFQLAFLTSLTEEEWHEKVPIGFNTTMGSARVKHYG